MIKIYNRDCMDAMAEMTENQFDLAIVDPPYGIGDFEQGTGKRNKNKKWEITWNEISPGKNYFDKLKKVSRNQIVWGANYYNCFSSSGGAVVWYKKVTHPSMSQCEIASLSMYRKVDMVAIEWNGFLKEEKSETIHPCQKPVSLYIWLLQNYAKPGDKILDTHLGSGSIAIACYDMGFDLIGFEKDPDYFKAAKARIENHQKQKKLFVL